MLTERELGQRLVSVANRSHSNLVQQKAAKALANVKRARTLLEKAALTLSWAERELGNEIALAEWTSQPEDPGKPRGEN